MDSHSKLHLLIFMSLLCLQVRGGSSDSILFLDSPGQGFLRSSDLASETGSMSISDAGAAVSVLLGFSPPASLSAESSSKLNEILLPNPFFRPRAVLMLEVHGTEDQLLVDSLGSAELQNDIHYKVLDDSTKAEIELPGNDEVSVLSLGESLSSECDAVCMDKELHDLASLLGASYSGEAHEPLSGELTVKLASGASLSLHMAKKSDKEFVVSLISLVRDVRREIEMHKDFTGSVQNRAELIRGSFVGIKALQEQYGPGGVAQQGMELFLTTLRRLYGSLQGVYQGQIVGVIIFNGESDSMLDVKSTSRPSRLLQDQTASKEAIKIIEVLLVRRILLWITGIILLISTILGIYFLFSMPVTRDTLLYSSVKLD